VDELGRLNQRWMKHRLELSVVIIRYICFFFL